MEGEEQSELQQCLEAYKAQEKEVVELLSMDPHNENLLRMQLQLRDTIDQIEQKVKEIEEALAEGTVKEGDRVFAPLEADKSQLFPAILSKKGEKISSVRFIGLNCSADVATDAVCAERPWDIAAADPVLAIPPDAGLFVRAELVRAEGGAATVRAEGGTSFTVPCADVVRRTPSAAAFLARTQVIPVEFGVAAPRPSARPAKKRAAPTKASEVSPEKALNMRVSNWKRHLTRVRDTIRLGAVQRPIQKMTIHRVRERRVGLERPPPPPPP
eukprot:gnl/Chilomastix_cuspidata/2809.p1 GENE.gnl/Chilomastix_cuspidata/2809~~gnl/Chilomastix_cuspidata/2809.p1  ORF type:complete len:281 (+),score=89.87 gnl/Chilomastix_cuspidata/2809:32-844(+)